MYMESLKTALKGTTTLKITTLKITSSGQISLPAAVRRRWGSRRVIVDDQGDRVLLRPLSDDPIGEALGSLAGRGPSSEQLRKAARAEDGSSRRPKQ